MAKRTIKCRISEKRFTVLRINGDKLDTHAGRSFEQAWHLANPDRGSTVEVFAVCARDAGEARLPGVYGWHNQLLRKFRFKGGR